MSTGTTLTRELMSFRALLPARACLYNTDINMLCASSTQTRTFFFLILASISGLSCRQWRCSYLKTSRCRRLRRCMISWKLRPIKFSTNGQLTRSYGEVSWAQSPTGASVNFLFCSLLLNKQHSFGFQMILTESWLYVHVHVSIPNEPATYFCRVAWK